jgi:hypothetical protein
LLDHIASTRPGLKEQVNNLSTILPGIVDHELPSQRLVLETFSYNQLSKLKNVLFEDLLQFSINTTYPHQALYEEVDSSCSQIPPNEQSFYGKDLITSLQSTSGDCTSEVLARFSPTGIGNETLVDRSENLDWALTNGIDDGNSDSARDDKQLSTVWLGSCEYQPNKVATRLGII